ncbi:MAG: HDOD domain-containing protein, partial [Gammaproteobacteria bacterium]|nr:HDOD domain-containing protein [Gammaproteobacteria bacterium]
MSTAMRAASNAAFDPETPPTERRTLRGRRVLVDERRAIAGYRMASSRSHSNPVPTPTDSDQPRKPTFVRFSCRFLDNDVLAQWNPDTVVLEISDLAESVAELGDAAFGRCKAARALGFKLAFDGRLLKGEYAAYVPLASYVILEMGVLELDRAAAMARVVRTKTQAVAVATQVRTPAEYTGLASAGVTMFEGLWFTQPPTHPDPKVQLSYGSLIKMLNMVAREAEVTEIEDLLKHEPGLSFKLLQFINSAGFGAKIEVTSFRHAVMVVGMKSLFRWTALLIGGTAPGSVAPAAGTLAIVRGRMMELLAAKSLQPAEVDLAFITGMFSMLDTLLCVPMAQALAMVELPASVADAILRGDGPFARYLAMARICESADEGALEILSIRHGIPVDRIIATHT